MKMVLFLVVSREEPEQITQNSKKYKTEKKERRAWFQPPEKAKLLPICVFFTEPSSKGQIKGHKISRIRQVSSKSYFYKGSTPIVIAALLLSYCFCKYNAS